MKRGKILLLLILVNGIAHLHGDQGQTLYMTDAFGQVYWVSSELSPPAQGLGKYGGHRLFDKNTKTAWAEGAAGAGIGEKIRLIVNRPLDHIDVVNGYAKSPGIFQANNRVRKLKLTAYAVQMPRDGGVTETGVPVAFHSALATFSATLKNTATTQAVPIPAQWREKTADKHPIAMEIEILSVYPGERFDDTCLSELSPVFARGIKVEIRNRDSEVWVVQGNRQHLVIKNTDAVFQLIETDESNHWAVLIEMPARAQGRVETRYRLLSIDKGRFVSRQKLGENIGELYGFATRAGRLYLRAGNTQNASEVLIDLETIQP